MPLGFIPALFLWWTPEAPPATRSEVEAAAAAGRDPQYQDCIERVFKNIKQGREFAEHWTSAGGGAPAEHCLAVAELADGSPKLAAVRLYELAENPESGDEGVRAKLYAEAAEAFVAASALDEAEDAIGAAFTLVPDADELYLPAARVYAARSKDQATIDAVTTAEARGVVSSAGYVLRGRARFRLANYRDAADDVMAALKIDPTNIDALVLRGDLAQKGIDIRADYTRAVGPGKKN